MLIESNKNLIDYSISSSCFSLNKNCYDKSSEIISHLIQFDESGMSHAQTNIDQSLAYGIAVISIAYLGVS